METKLLEPHEAEASIVRLIFEPIAEEAALVEVAAG